MAVDDADQFIDDQDLEAARDAVVSTRSKTKRKLEQGPDTLVVNASNQEAQAWEEERCSKIVDNSP